MPLKNTGDKKNGTNENTENLIDNFIEKLETIDFNNLESLLDWIHDFLEVSVDIDINEEDKNKIISEFAKYGFFHGVNFLRPSENESKNYANFIIGNALSFIINLKVYYFSSNLKEAIPTENEKIFNNIQKWKTKYGKGNKKIQKNNGTNTQVDNIIKNNSN